MKVTGSNITITDSVVNKMDIVPLGNCEQDTYTGKNKLSIVNKGPYEWKGLTYQSQNGVITINGTTTDTTIIDFVLNQTIGSSLGILTKSLNPVGTYTGIQTSLRANDPNTSVGLWSNNAENKTETLSGNAYYFRLQVNSGITINCTLKPQIEVGSTATPYEPYVGGIPSPNPSYPQPIKVVTGDNQVVIQNKNLAYIEDGFDGYFRDYRNGNKTYASSYNSYIARVKPNTTYIGSYDSSESERTGISNLCYFDKNMNYISGIQYTSVQGDAFTTPNNCAFVTVAVIKTQTKFQIEVGTTATDYIAHQEQSTTLHLGSLELCKIGDYQDIILGSKDNWKVVRKVGKIASYNGETITTDYISTTGGLDTGALVYYGLATPIEETISDQALINELNGLQDLLSYNGTTNITITSDSNNAQMIVEVTYTSESDMNEKLTNIFNSIKSKLYHIIRAL